MQDEPGPIEFVRRGGTETEFYACGSCGRVHQTRDDATDCPWCRRNRCECGAECPQGRTACDACRRRKDAEREAARIAKAKIVSIDDYESDHVYVGDEYETPEDLFAHMGSVDELDAQPDFGWAVVPHPVPRFDAVSLLEYLLADHYEDAIEYVDIDGLQVALDAWHKDNTDVHGYMASDDIAVDLRPLKARLRAEMEADDAG